VLGVRPSFLDLPPKSRGLVLHSSVGCLNRVTSMSKCDIPHAALKSEIVKPSGKPVD
jgi:hypothetical protein